MPRPNLRSRTLRRVSVRTPGGSTVRHYRKRKPAGAKCASCSRLLSGVPRERPHVMKALSKTQKRPERPHGGELCSSCTRRKIVTESRN